MTATLESSPKVGRAVPNAPWRETTLGQVISASTEKVDPLDRPDAPYIGLEHIERDVGVISGQGKASDVRSTKSVFGKGDLLYGKLRPYLNKVWVAQFDGVCSTDILVFPQNDLVDASFLKYRFMTSDFVGFASEHSNGVNLPRVNAKALARFPLKLPPLPEQRKIVAEIEKRFTRLDAGVTALRRVQANLKRYRAAILKPACEGRLVPSAATFDPIPLKDLMEGLGQGWSPKCDLHREPEPDEWAIITTTAVQPMRYVDNQGKPLPENLTPRTHIEIKSGDFLMTRKGPRNRTGVTCLVRSTRHRLMVCDTVYRFRCREDRVTAPFLELALNSPPVVEEINRRKSGISDSGISLTHHKIGGVPIPIPPIAEQARIVAEVECRLSVVDELESVVKANLQRAARLREAILQRVFIQPP